MIRINRIFKVCKEKVKNFILWEKKVLFAKSDYKISLTKKIIYAFRGFDVNEYVWYNLKDNDYRNYISDFARIKSRQINDEYKIILDNKLLFEEIFKNHVRVPKNYAWISNGRIYGLHEYNINEENIIDFLKEIKISVLKWEGGYEGNGIYIIQLCDENKFIVNGEEKNAEELREIFLESEKAILSEYMIQSKFSKELYPFSTNTIRIVCAKGKTEKCAKIIKAVQRIGSDYSKPVDNMSAGGFTSEINLETGELSQCVAKYGEMDKRMKFFDNHPDTNGQIAGKVIPNWDSIKEEVTKLTNEFPYLNFVAWDVLLTEEEICIIEGNASSGLRYVPNEGRYKKL